MTIERSKTSGKTSKAIKQSAKEKAAAAKTVTKRIARRSDAPTGALTEREARSEERLRELAAWHMLHGMDEATARRRAQEEMDDDPRKD